MQKYKCTLNLWWNNDTAAASSKPHLKSFTLVSDPSNNTNSCPFLVFCHRPLNKRINYFEQLLAAVSEQMETWHLTIIKRLDTNVERLPLNCLRQGCSSAIKNHQTPDNELGGEVGFHAEDCLLRDHYNITRAWQLTGHGHGARFISIWSRTQDFLGCGGVP